MTQTKIEQAAEGIALRRLPIWSWYLKGARDMLLKLRDSHLLDERHPSDYNTFAIGNNWYQRRPKSQKIINKAVFDMLMSDKANIDRFLSEDYDSVKFKDAEFDKKDKLTKCTAFFAKRVTKYEEI